MKPAMIVLVVLLVVASASAVTFWFKLDRLRDDERVWNELKTGFRYACMDNYLRLEPGNSAVVLFRAPCRKLGIWRGP